MKTLTILIIAFLVSGCIPEGYEVTVPDLPCIDGWQYDHIGQPMVNPDTGAQHTCTTNEQ